MTSSPSSDMPDAADPPTDPGWRAMLAVDLDGTLLDDERKLPARARAALEWCAEQRVLRVVATGRNLYSARKVIDDAFPIDRLVCSTGVATYAMPGFDLERAEVFPHEVALRAVEVLKAHGLDFMLHLEVPDNHGFYYYRASYENEDFDRRLAIYRDFAAPLPPHLTTTRRYSQLVAVGQPRLDGAEMFARLRLALPDAEVVRATSPLDDTSPWFEVYPRAVNKAHALERLRRRSGIADNRVVAVGNDYNDEEMLGWATRPFVVANAADALHERFPAVGSNNDGGVAEAVMRAFGWAGAGDAPAGS